MPLTPMNPFQRAVAIRITAVSVALACIASPIAWWFAREKSEQGVVSLAIEESKRLLDHFYGAQERAQNKAQSALAAAQALSGGLFDIAEIYDRDGMKLAEALTTKGEATELALPKHVVPRYSTASYVSYELPSGEWGLRVFVPLPDRSGSPEIVGYFEGIRVVPAWQHQQILHDALTIAFMVGLASLLCGAALFPVLVRLANDNTAKTLALVDSQQALIEGLRQSESELEDKVAQRTQELQRAQARAQDLLHNMLPAQVADELSRTGSTTPVRHESVTILFTDFSDFTLAASTMPAHRVVAELNDIFAAFDAITDQYGVEKIKTIGDAYMAAAGVPTPCVDHAHRCVKAGLAMLSYLEQRNLYAPFKWSLRVGLHTGPVVAGVVGTKKYAFDVWGDTVNIASRMESAGDVGRVNVSAYTYDLIQDAFECEYRGKVQAKGKGAVDMYFVAAARVIPAGLS